ncbi:MAG: C_GCAxxG_C_C family protein [Desulfobacteraceae bacterium]|nr:C_GCAxxG_C_C family protein [Desulfobacteraceae bacterium]
MENNHPALEYFTKGYSCSEAIAAAYAPKLGLDLETAVKIATGFSGGMAQGKTCGAVTGAFMVLGLTAGSGAVGDACSRDRVYLLVQEFSQRFTERCGATRCSELLAMNGIDMNNPEQMKTLRQTGPCAEMVEAAARILDEVCEEEF